MVTAGNELGQRLRLALKQAGLTHADLAGADLTPVYIKMIEAGQLRPSLELLQELAERLNRPVSYFLEGLPGSRADVFLLLNLGSYYLMQEDPARAAPLLEQSQKYALGLHDDRLEGLVERALCRLCWLQGDYETAERHGTKALKLLQEKGEPEEIAEASIYLGNICWAKQESYAAQARYQDAAALAKLGGNQQLLRLAYSNLGNAYFMLENWDRANEYYERALRLTLTSEVEHRARLQLNHALACRERGDLDRALQLSTEALAALDEQRRPTSVAGIYNSIAAVHALQGDRPQACKAYRHALSIIGDHRVPEHLEAQRELARLTLEEGHVSDACRQAERALAIAEEMGDRREQARCSLLLGQALASKNAFGDAETHLLRACTIFEEIGMRQSFLVATDILEHICNVKEGVE